MKGIFVLTGLLICSGATLAQVDNNAIRNRVQLNLDESPIHSSTSNSTVEWECINKSLTNKCLVYHNDQWFFINVSQPGKYYLNFRAQECRELRGLQVILIEGNPCETQTYRIKKCIPKLSQDDIFIELDSVQSGITYLLNIDGFLGDFCEFTIQLATKPNGFPYTLEDEDQLDIKAGIEDSIVTLGWKADENVIESIREFAVYRVKDMNVKSTPVQIVAVEKNAYGAYSLEYSVTDTLTEHGTFTYRVFGVANENEQYRLLDVKRVIFREEFIAPVVQNDVTLPLDFKRRVGGVEIYIYDKDTGRLLRHYYQSVDTRKHNSVNVRLGQFMITGTKAFQIKLVHEKNHIIKEFVFSLDRHGRLNLQQ